MQYAFERISGRTRLLIMSVLLLLTIILKVVEQIPDFFSGLAFSLLLIFVVAEIAIYGKRKTPDSR